MVERYLPHEVPTVYRGGLAVRFNSHEVKIDRMTGLLKPSHGISVDSDTDNVIRFGGAYKVISIPHGLTIIQRGQRETHFEIVPASPMSPAEFQALLDEIELEPYTEEYSR